MFFGEDGLAPPSPTRQGGRAGPQDFFGASRKFYYRGGMDKTNFFVLNSQNVQGSKGCRGDCFGGEMGPYEHACGVIFFIWRLPRAEIGE